MFMKRILTLFMLIMCISLSSFAQVQWYRTYSFKQANVVNGRYYWGSLKSSDMNISIDLNEDVVTIYSPSMQRYYVYDTYNNGNSYRDANGGTTVKFYVIDQDGDRGEMRLRIDPQGNSQIYIDFSNIAWVYGVRRTR